MPDNPDPFVADFLATPQRRVGKTVPTRRVTPHGRLKQACRRALHQYFKESGAIAVLIPIHNLAVQIPGTQRKYQTGRPGAGDDFYLVNLGAVTAALSVEYKASRDVQSPKQAEFQRKWKLAGGRYLIAREPGALVVAVRNVCEGRW